MIDSVTLNALMQTGILAISAPVVAIAVWKMRTRKSLVPYFAGLLCFLLFSRILENIPHTFCIIMDNPVSRAINGNVVLFTIYAASMAALFEETGRFILFHFLIKKYPEKETSVTFGLGHGGMECILLLGITYLQYYTYAQLINESGTKKILQSAGDNEMVRNSMQSLIDTITNMHSYDCFVAGWERVFAMMLQVALSILVFEAVKYTEKKYMFFIAMLLHFIADIPAALYQKNAISLLLCEIIFMIFSVCVFVFSVIQYRKMKKEKESDAVVAHRHSLHQLANKKLK